MFDFISNVSITDVILLVTSIVTVASVVAQMTPNTKDNEWVAKVAKVVNFFALNWGTDKIAK